MDKHEVWITGIGLVSCFGEGAGRHWELLGVSSAPRPVIDSSRFAPYSIHPLPEMDWSKQIPRRGDQRQMENWQRLGTYTAGLALEDAGLKDNEDLVSTMDLVVAAGGGERDIVVDDSIMKDALQRNDRERLLNERLPNDLRPTLFLAQLSNLMAGNISIVHRVTGSSRTYMGEESAGITAIENAMRRIEAGQSTHALVGGAFNAERPDLLLSLELGHYIWRGEPLPVAARQAKGGGSITGSAGAFLVLEEAGHARARDARPYARLSNVASDLGPRDAAQTRARLESMLERIHAPAGAAVVSGATGCAEITDLEFDVLRDRLGKEVALRAITTMIGNPVEANFPAGIALAALALYHGGMYPPFEAAEKPFAGRPESVVVSAIGHYRGEGFGLLEKI